jgi:hypothetical protein
MASLKLAVSLGIAVCLGGLTLALGGCSKAPKAPDQAGVCWHAVPMSDGTIKFNVLAKNQASLEVCAAQLESMRLRFRGLGLAQKTMLGAYQGNYLFLQPEGVFTAKTYDGNRYLVLVRTGDGRLAKIGEMPLQ